MPSAARISAASYTRVVWTPVENTVTSPSRTIADLPELEPVRVVEEDRAVRAGEPQVDRAVVVDERRDGLRASPPRRPGRP